MKGWKHESSRHSLAAKGIKSGRIIYPPRGSPKTEYYYADEKTKDGKYIVFKTHQEDKARTIAENEGLHLAGGMFGGTSKPYDFKTNYKVISVPAKTPETKDPRADFIDAMINYESGKLSPAQETKFLKQVKKKGLANKLQGHYGREIARRGI